nr:hypothetical protein [Tanacetum cinerariifolium]
MYQMKSNETHDTNEKLYNTLYESITLDQEALDAQDTEPSFNKRSHDDQDPTNDREGVTRKKRKKDAGEPSSRSSKKDKALVVPVQEDAPADQPQDQEEDYIQKRPIIGWFNKKSGSAKVANRKSTWFDMILKSNIDQNEDHILRPSTVVVEKKLKVLIKKDELTIADREGVGLEKFKEQYKNDVELEYHVNQLKATMLTEAQWSNNEALSGIHHLDDVRKDFFKVEMGNKSSDKVYSDKRIIFVIRGVVKKKWGYGFLSPIVVRKSDKKEYKFSYADLPGLSLNDVEFMYLLKRSSKYLSEITFGDEIRDTLEVQMGWRFQDSISQTISNDEGLINFQLIIYLQGVSDIAKKIEEEFNTSPDLSSSKHTQKEIKLEHLSMLVQDVGVDFMDLDSQEDDHIIVVDDSEWEKEDEEIHATKHTETEDTSAPLPPSPSLKSKN